MWKVLFPTKICLFGTWMTDGNHYVHFLVNPFPKDRFHMKTKLAIWNGFEIMVTNTKWLALPTEILQKTLHCFYWKVLSGFIYYSAAIKDCSKVISLESILSFWFHSRSRSDLIQFLTRPLKSSWQNNSFMSQFESGPFLTLRRFKNDFSLWLVGNCVPQQWFIIALESLSHFVKQSGLLSCLNQIIRGHESWSDRQKAISELKLVLDESDEMESRFSA